MQPFTIAGRPARLLQVFNRYLAPGGEEKSVARIADHLEQGGLRTIRFWRSSDEWRQPGSPPRWRQPGLMLNNPAVLQALRATHLREQPDAWILHNVIPVVSLGVYALARELQVPVINWLHNYRPISPGGTLRAAGKTLIPGARLNTLREIAAGTWHNPLLTSWLAFAYWRLRRRGDFASVAAWVAISREMARHFAAGGLPRDRLFAIPHSWDHVPRQQVLPDAGHFLYLGRIAPEKGVSFLVELWRRFSLNTDPKLVIAGDGPLKSVLESVRSPNVRWVGHVEAEKKQKLLAQARALLVPSSWPEPLGLVTYEAYEHHKPVLASDTGGLRDTVIDQQTGRLLPVESFDEWQAAIRFLHEHPDVAAQQGNNGCEWLIENTSPSQWLSQVSTLLQQVCGHAPPAPR